MEITYDPAKRAATLAARGLDFDEAAKVFASLAIDIPDLRFDYAEARTMTVGFLHDRMVVVIWTPVGDGRRIISMRKANDREQARFGRQLSAG